MYNNVCRPNINYITVIDSTNIVSKEASPYQIEYNYAIISYYYNYYYYWHARN